MHPPHSARALATMSILALVFLAVGLAGDSVTGANAAVPPPATSTPAPTDTPTPSATNTPTPSEIPTSTIKRSPLSPGIDYRFAVIGDYGYGTTSAGNVAALVVGWNPDFVITLGDNNYPNGAAETIDDNVGQFYSAFIGDYQGGYGSGSPVNRFWPSLGNHDWDSLSCDSGGCSGPYFDYFTLPGNERYYEVDYGLVGLFVVDSANKEPDGNSASSTQAQWLQQRLATSLACFNIVYFHHTPYSNLGSNKLTMRWPFAQWGADVVMAGHVHKYERLEVDGIPYFVNGAGGGQGAMLVTATSSGITYQFYEHDGQLIDELFVPKICQLAPTATPTPINTLEPTATATLTPTPVATSTATRTPTFNDVPADHWAWQFVEALVDAGITSGFPDGTYRPDNPVTRAEMAVFIKKGIHGSIYKPPTPDGSHPFSDISGHWAEAWIEDLFDEGFTSGFPDGTYRPESQVTRAEIAVFLKKAIHGSAYTSPTPDGSHPFSDIAGHWAEAWIEDLFDEGITSGFPDGTYRPQNPVSRGEMAVFMVNAFSLALP